MKLWKVSGKGRIVFFAGITKAMKSGVYQVTSLALSVARTKYIPRGKACSAKPSCDLQ